MSIETLKQDLQQVTAAIASTTLIDFSTFMQSQLLPWLESLVDEVSEMDESIEDLVHQSVEVLHTESAEVFAGLIAGGAMIATELLTRAGDDKRLIAMVKEWRALATQGKAILEEIVIPDDEEEPDSDTDTETAPVSEDNPA